MQRHSRPCGTRSGTTAGSTHSTTTCHRTTFATPHRTHDKKALEATVTALRTAFPNLHLTIHEMIEDADRVAVRWHSTGTHDAPFRGIPPTGRTVTMSGTTFVRFDKSKVAEEWVHWDDTDITRSLGVITLGQHPACKEQR